VLLLRRTPTIKLCVEWWYLVQVHDEIVPVALYLGERLPVVSRPSLLLRHNSI
jgi:hypothetical protein